MGLSVGTKKTKGVRATNETGCKSFSTSKGILDVAYGITVSVEATTNPKVEPSGLERARAEALIMPEAPGRFSTITASPHFFLSSSAISLAVISIGPHD